LPDTDAFNVSVDNSVCFLVPLIESWDIDLANPYLPRSGGGRKEKEPFISLMDFVPA